MEIVFIMNNILSPSNEDYLEAIFDLSSVNSAVRSIDVSTRLNVSRASVNKAVGLLKDAGLVVQQPYGTITLTDEGRYRAARVRTRHDTLRAFLNGVLGIDIETAEDEACKIEHIISDKTLEHLIAFMDKQKREN